MSSEYSQLVSEIDRLLKVVKPSDAEVMMRTWIDGLAHGEIQVATPYVLQAISLFLPKRRERLLAHWAARTNHTESDRSNAPVQAADPNGTVGISWDTRGESEVRDFARHLRSSFQELSDRHIFKWGTHYTDHVRECFAQALSLAEEPQLASAVYEHVAREYREHTREIFEKGFAHGVSTGDPLNKIIDRSRRGFLRFLEVPISIGQDVASADSSASMIVSRVASAMIRGIVIGYGRSERPDSESGSYLLEIANQWCSILPYLHPEDLYAVANDLPASALKDAVVRCIHPVAVAVERVASDGNRSVLNRLGHSRYSEQAGRIEFSIPLAAPQNASPIVIHYYLAPSFADVRRVEESGYRGAALVIGMFSEDASVSIHRLSALRNTVVDANSGGAQDTTASAERATVILQRVTAGRGVVNQVVPLAYNWARDFPLFSPIITEQYRVRRPSVRTLLGNVERRNGIHVWCSVRRSGKSTACFALESTTGSSIVLAQTTAPTTPYVGATRFYRALSEVIQTKVPLPDDFVESTVRACIPAGKAKPKVVLIIDEYESLFHRLNDLGATNAELRYTVVHPLLSQLVSFSRNNLLIFVGQRPDAHQIFLDQNQLSPYVQQDHFPLFEHHGDGGSEFKDLLGKVLPEPFRMDASFIREVYREAGGHPYLTVSVLVCFVEWLIEQQRSMSDLELRAADFRAFSEQRLSPDQIAMVSELRFFHGTASEALSEAMRLQDPWLHAVYWTLQQVCRLNPRSLACSRSEYRELVGSSAGQLHVGYDPDYILRTGSEANFLRVEGDTVMPQIRVLGRLAAVASARPSGNR